jgi:hypothetical protein
MNYKEFEFFNRIIDLEFSSKGRELFRQYLITHEKRRKIYIFYKKHGIKLNEIELFNFGIIEGNTKRDQKKLEKINN